MLFVILLCVVLGLLYLFVKKRNNYWNERKVVNVIGNPIIGVTLDFLLGTRHLEKIFTDLYRLYPEEKYIGIYEFLRPKLFVKDPELINHILVKDFSHFHDRLGAFEAGHGLTDSVIHLVGDQWKTVRNKLLPTFSAAKLKLMYGLIEEVANFVVDTRLRPCAATGEPFEVKDLMARFSLDAIGSSAFGLQFNTLKEPDSQYRNIGKMIFAITPVNLLRMAIQSLNPNYIKWFGIRHTPKEVDTFFYDLLENAEKLRKIDTNRRCDFLQMMLDLKDEEQNKSDSLFKASHVASNMMIFYVAGFETTSITLSFCLYEMALNPEVQEKVIQEIKAVREKNNGIIDFNATKDLVYMEMVILETLRKHSPAGMVERMCTQTYQLPGTSLVLNPGDRVACAVTPLHHDEQYYPNPEKFDPERFSEENVAARPQYTFLPFGDGPRICLGLRFAKLEMKCMLVCLLSKFRVSPCSKTEIPVTFNTRSFFHTPKNDIWLTVKEIQNNE